MSTLAAVVTLVDLEVAAGTVVASYSATLSDGQVASFGEDGLVSFTVAAGKFTVSVVALAADGTVIGAPVVSEEVEVIDVPTTIMVKVPGTVTLSIAA